MKALSLFLGVAALFASAHAATISVIRGTGNPGVGVSLASGTALSAGGFYIGLGTFTNAEGATAEPIINSDASLAAAIQSFDLFASTTSLTSGTTQGLITGQFTSLGNPDPSQFNSKPLYFIIGNGATLATSTQFGIFKLTAGTAFPANVVPAGSTNALIPNGTAITALEGAGSVNGNTFVLVPEPSTALLGLLGAVGLLRRRRI